MLSSSVLHVDTCRYKSVEKFLQHHEFEMSHVQTFFPCIPLVESQRKSKWAHICLSKKLTDVVCFKPNNYVGTVIDSSGGKTQVPFHVKVTPILEPRFICENMYVKNTTVICGFHHCVHTKRRKK